jgi:hypothetical protein
MSHKTFVTTNVKIMKTPFQPSDEAAKAFPPHTLASAMKKRVAKFFVQKP